MKSIMFTLIAIITSCTCIQAQGANVQGVLITSKGDTLKGNFKNFKENLLNYNGVIYVDENNQEKIFDAKDIKMVIANGSIYESYKYFKNSGFSGTNAPGQKLIMLLYSSPSVKLYYFSLNNEYIYDFYQKKEVSYYTPFDRADAASYMTNYNKKLSNIFKECEVVKQKAQSGEYKLKDDHSKGPIQALVDYEINCGSKDPEKYFGMLETMKNIK